MAAELILWLDEFIRLVGINRATQHSLLLGAGASISSGRSGRWRRDQAQTPHPVTFLKAFSMDVFC